MTSGVNDARKQPERAPTREASERGYSEPTSALWALIGVLATLHPAPTDVSKANDDVKRALRFLDSGIDADEITAAGDVLGGVTAIGLVAILGVLTTPTVGLFFGAACGLGMAVGTRHLPRWLATVRRTRALGAAPGLVARAALRIRIEPTPERAAAFAAATGRGPLAHSLGTHARRATGTPRSGLETFAAAWRPWFPALDRAAALLEAGAASPPEQRQRSLDRALETVTDAARSRLASFAGDVRGPASGAYAFGVVLPLSLAGMLPAARTAGVPVDVFHVVGLYDVALPALLLGASGWVVLQRPVAFPPPQVPRSHPDRPSRRVLAPAIGLGCGIVGSVLGVASIGLWAGVIAALGLGVGSALFVTYRPVTEIRERVRAVEAGLDDGLYLVGRRVASGESVERAIASAARELPGATGAMFEDALRVNRRLRIGVRASFLGRHGALATLPSQRARGAGELLGIAAADGQPAGAAIVSLADHLAELRRIERESRRELASITSTLGNTAALFGPLVGGATVALAGRMETAVSAGGSVTAAAGATGAAGTAAIGTAELGLAVGGYVLATAVILTGVATTLERGFDRALVGYRVGIALPAATTTYLATYVGVALVL